MSHCSRRNFLRAGIGRGRAGGNRKPAAACGARHGNRLGSSGEIRGEGNPARIWHRHDQRKSAARSGPGPVHRLVRYAYDQGIRFFETAESYGEMHQMLGVALKGIPRDSYR